MSNLRRQLDSAKSEYLAYRYPGNLADEISPSGPNPFRLIAYAAPLFAAAAAALFIYLGTGHVGTSPSAKPVAFLTPAPTTTASINDDAIVPQFIELTPSAETLSLPSSSESFSVPAIQLVPSWDNDAATTSSTSSTTQEST